MVGPAVSLLVGLSAILRLLSTARHRSGATGVHPAAHASAPGVLVLLPEREGLLSDRSELSRIVDPGAGEEPLESQARRP